jgi:hypothetical protein
MNEDCAVCYSLVRVLERRCVRLTFVMPNTLHLSLPVLFMIGVHPWIQDESVDHRESKKKIIHDISLEFTEEHCAIR